MKKIFISIFLILLSLIITNTSNVYALTGTGEENNPYLISIGEENRVTGNSLSNKKIYNKLVLNEKKNITFAIEEPNYTGTITGTIGYSINVYDNNGNYYYSSSGMFGENKYIEDNETIFIFALSLKPGTYYFVFEPIFNATTYSYKYMTTESEIEEYDFEGEYNNTKELANQLSPGTMMMGYMQPNSNNGISTDHDFFYFNLEQGTKTIIKTNIAPLIKNPNYYPVLHLYTPNKQTTDIIYNINQTSTDSKLVCNTSSHTCTYTFTPTISGKYYIEVTNGTSSQVMYGINVSSYKPFLGFELAETSGTIYVGDKKELDLIINPEDTTDDLNISFTSSNTNVATVDEDGIITALKAGTTTITVKINNKTKRYNLTVKDKTIESINLDKETANLNVGEKLKLNTIITPDDYTVDLYLNWQSSNNKVATVDDEGNVTAISPGTAIISVSDFGKAAFCEITVASDSVPVYRMYNPVNGEHLYTADAHEVDVIYRTQGWGFEGVGWYSSKSGTKVYRLYSPKFNNHLYTSDENEMKIITSKYGWVFDNIRNGVPQPVMYSNGDTKIYRLYNPGQNDQHHLTTDENEYNIIPKWGWRQEGVAMKATSLGIPVITYYYKDSHKNIDFVNIKNNKLDDNTNIESYSQALERAKSYLKSLSFSYQSLIDQLLYEGYSYDEAVYAVNNCGADWFQEAIKSAKKYVEHQSFSYQGLISQLEYEKFTPEQAIYGANKCGADWFQESIESAKNYINSQSFSYQKLIEQLEYEKYTHEQAVYGADNCEADWNQEALETATRMQQYYNSRDQLKNYLINTAKFTNDQAEYAVSQLYT